MEKKLTPDEANKFPSTSPTLCVLVATLNSVNQKRTGCLQSPPGFSSGTGQSGELIAVSTIHYATILSV